MNVWWKVIVAIIVLAVLPLFAFAQESFDWHVRWTQQTTSMPMEHPELSRPFYRERTFLVLVGLVTAGAGFVAFRIVRRRWRSRGGPVEFVNEAVLVVDLVESTHIATHYGNGLAMRATNFLKERTLAAAQAHGLSFAENTGDGYFMTFPSVISAIKAAITLLEDLKDNPPTFSGSPIEVRAGISYGEILLDSLGARHGAAINKAFRLEGLSRENFDEVDCQGQLGEIADRNRIFLDEEAAQELRSSEIPLRFVGFCSLKGFSGLHRVFEVQWKTSHDLLVSPCHSVLAISKGDR